MAKQIANNLKKRKHGYSVQFASTNYNKKDQKKLYLIKKIYMINILKTDL